MEADDLAARLDARLSLTEEENAPVEIQRPSSTSPHQPSPLFVKMLNARRINEAAFTAAMKRAWSLPTSTRAMKVGADVFCFLIPPSHSASSILANGPWSFDGQMLLFETDCAGKTVESLPFNHLAIWVRMSGLPVGVLDLETCKTVGAAIGRVISVDIKEGEVIWSPSVKIRVEIDVRKPLRRVVKLLAGSSKTPVSCPLQYERLTSFCSFCGILLHSSRQCPRLLEDPDIISRPVPYPDSLRAASPRPFRADDEAPSDKGPTFAARRPAASAPAAMGTKVALAIPPSVAVRSGSSSGSNPTPLASTEPGPKRDLVRVEQAGANPMDPEPGCQPVDADPMIISAPEPEPALILMKPASAIPTHYVGGESSARVPTRGKSLAVERTPVLADVTALSNSTDSPSSSSDLLSETAGQTLSSPALHTGGKIGEERPARIRAMIETLSSPLPLPLPLAQSLSDVTEGGIEERESLMDLEEGAPFLPPELIATAGRPGPGRMARLQGGSFRKFRRRKVAGRPPPWSQLRGGGSAMPDQLSTNQLALKSPPDKQGPTKVVKKRDRDEVEPEGVEFTELHSKSLKASSLQSPGIPASSAAPVAEGRRAPC